MAAEDVREDREQDPQPDDEREEDQHRPEHFEERIAGCEDHGSSFTGRGTKLPALHLQGGQSREQRTASACPHCGISADRAHTLACARDECRASTWAAYTPLQAAG